jgi:multidrug transporter EmrE-like cation transporter
VNEFSISGGAYIGNTRASKPFATLRVTPNMLMVNIGFVGQLYFNAEDITLIEPTSGLSGGIRIIHTVKSYPQKVTFFTSTPYSNLVENMKATGFFNKEIMHDQSIWHQVKKFQEQGRLPVKTIAMIIFIVGWNIPFLIQLALHNINSSITYAPISLLFATIFIVLTLLAEPFRMLIIKEDRNIKDMHKSLYFLLLIVFILLVFSFLFQHLPPRGH